MDDQVKTFESAHLKFLEYEVNKFLKENEGWRVVNFGQSTVMKGFGTQTVYSAFLAHTAPPPRAG